MLVNVSHRCDELKSFRVSQVQGMFDLKPGEHLSNSFSVEVPGLDEDWKIGLIVGPSGSGKTSVARQAFPGSYWANPDWPADKAVIDCFDNRDDLSISDITNALASVGFSSPPSWLRPYHTLSNGEQFRCQLARAVLDPSDSDLIVFDEFTSVVDRTVAKIGSAAIAKSIRRRKDNKRFIAVACHYDIMEWLEPDWVLDMATKQLARGRLRRPPIELEIVSCDAKKAWKLFARHHYLSSSLPAVCEGFAVLAKISDDKNTTPQLAAFVAVARFFGNRGPKKRRTLYRISRIVTMPDFQGVGIARAAMDRLGEHYHYQGKDLSILTSHPAMIRACENAKHWKLTSRVFAASKSGSSDSRISSFKSSRSTKRCTCSFRYVRPPLRIGCNVK